MPGNTRKPKIKANVSIPARNELWLSRLLIVTCWLIRINRVSYGFGDISDRCDDVADGLNDVGYRLNNVTDRFSNLTPGGGSVAIRLSPAGCRPICANDGR